MILTLFVTTIKYFLAALVMVGFVYFILLRAISTKNYKRKALYILISGMVLFLFFVGGLIYDIINELIIFKDAPFYYFAFLVVSLAFVIFFPLYYYIKGVKSRQRLITKFIKKQTSIPEHKDKKEMLYLILNYNGNILLKKTNEKEEEIYNTIIVKFGSTDFFHDEFVNKVIYKLGLNVSNQTFIGTATKAGKKDEVYYCYSITVEEITKEIESFIEISKFDLLNVNLNDIDKSIIYTSIIESNFNIKL